MEAAGGKALACVVDIRDEQQIGEAVEKAVSKFGGASVFWFLILSFLFVGPDILNGMIDRNRRAGEQRQRHQFDGNLRDTDEESWPDAGSQPKGNLFDVRQ